MSDKQPDDATPTTLDLFTVAETAAILDVNHKTVRDWISKGALPAIRLGPAQRLVRIRRVDLESFVNQGEV